MEHVKEPFSSVEDTFSSVKEPFSSVEDMIASIPKPKPWSPPSISETMATPRTECIQNCIQSCIQELQRMGLNEAWVDEIEVTDDDVIVTAKPEYRDILLEVFKGKSTCLDKRLVVSVRRWDVFN